MQKSLFLFFTLSAVCLLRTEAFWDIGIQRNDIRCSACVNALELSLGGAKLSGNLIIECICHIEFLSDECDFIKMKREDLSKLVEGGADAKEICTFVETC